MIILGLVLLLIGIFAAIHILYVVGGILLIIGIVLLIASSLGHAVGGRQHWY